MLKNVSVVAACFVVVSLFAQVPPEGAPQPTPPALVEVEPDAPQAQQPPVSQAVETPARPSGGVQTDTVYDDNVIGTNGSLYLGSPNVALKVFGTGSIQLFTNASSGGTGGIERMRIWPDTGNVGIGTSDPPLRKLEVVGSGSVGSILGKHDTTYTGNVYETPIGVYGLTYSRIPNSSVTQSGSAYGVRGVSYLLDTGTLTSAMGLSSEAGVASGALNTGTITNAYGLYTSVRKNSGIISNSYGAYVAYVDASVNGYGLLISDILAPNAWGVYQYGTNDYNYFGGKVGIGVTQPLNQLHVSAASNTAIRMQHTDPTSLMDAILFYEGDTMYGFINQRGSNSPSEPRQFNIGNSHLSGATALYAGGSQRIVIQSGGNVGIGTPTPTAKLHVDGSVVVTSGNITALGGVIGAVYQDVAEWVPATTDMEPGTVVVLNEDRTNEVMPSHGAYDTSVAGVVSAQPGVLLGTAGDSKEQVATTGRVKVRVDARRAPIRVGDLLVTSDISGTAMRSEPTEINGRRFHQPGTIIGKALEPLGDGVGEILVLLSLQ